MVIKIYRDADGKVDYTFQQTNEYTADELISVVADFFGKVCRVERRIEDHDRYKKEN